MGFRNLQECLQALEKKGELVRIDQEVDANLEVAAIQRRVFRAKGPALLFTRVKGCDFPMAGNIFGTMERTRFIFEDTLKAIDKLIKLKINPWEVLKRPWQLPGVAKSLLHVLPRWVKTGPVLERQTRISHLPQLKSWPLDGGAYITLPQVYTESPESPGLACSNLGMYRVQLGGNEYEQDVEVGLHYQIHRGIGVHHQQALKQGMPLPVNIFIGGPPAMTLAAIMPLPEGVPEILFAGVLAGHRIELIKRPDHLPILAQADFCIVGHIDPGGEKPEGPFGDHLGYYSLKHDFPVLKVEKVYHRRGAVWPFTTVGRPPQEDTIFGTFIHELTENLVPTVFSGVKEVHAVDAAGVHPLLLAIGRESYVPYARERKPQELLTSALSLLGQTQTSLSKYLFIAAQEDDPELSTRHIPGFFKHVLERVDLGRDLHFITRTTIDTLDYSGISLNQGSKLIVAACGAKKRELPLRLPSDSICYRCFPPGFGKIKFFAPGIVVLQGPEHKQKRDTHDPELKKLAAFLEETKELKDFPLLVVVDDSEFASSNWDNFLWVVFTRSDPATDIYGAGEFIHCKHWGCSGPLIIDARLKSYYAPPLVDDPEIEKKVDKLGEPGGPLYGII